MRANNAHMDAHSGRNPALDQYYTTRNGQKVVIRPSTDKRPLEEDHMSLFARLASITNMHGKPGEPHKGRGR